MKDGSVTVFVSHAFLFDQATNLKSVTLEIKSLIYLVVSLHCFTLLFILVLSKVLYF